MRLRLSGVIVKVTLVLVVLMTQTATADCSRRFCSQSEAVAAITDELKILALEQRLDDLRGGPGSLRIGGKIKDLKRELEYAKDSSSYSPMGYVSLRQKHAQLDQLRGEAGFLELQIRFEKLRGRTPDERLFTSYQLLADREKRIETEIRELTSRKITPSALAPASSAFFEGAAGGGGGLARPATLADFVRHPSVGASSSVLSSPAIFEGRGDTGLARTVVDGTQVLNRWLMRGRTSPPPEKTVGEMEGASREILRRADERLESEFSRFDVVSAKADCAFAALMGDPCPVSDRVEEKPSGGILSFFGFRSKSPPKGTSSGRSAR